LHSVDSTIISRKFLITFDYCSNPIPLYPPSPFEGEGGRYFRKGTTSLLNSHFVHLLFCEGKGECK
jgi:hypothetical protein